MAGHSAKRTFKNAESKSFYYFWTFVFGCVFSGVLNVGLLGNLTLSGVAASSFLGLVSWLCYRMIHAALELGVGYSVWQDVFIINLTVQMLSLISSYFWLIYLSVPGYAVFKFGKRIIDWVFTPKESDTAPVDSSSKRSKARR